MEQILNNISTAVCEGKLEACLDYSKQAIEAGIDIQTIINCGLTVGMEIIGERFHKGTAFVPNLLLSARAMKGALEYIKPFMSADISYTVGKIVIGTVKGDLHDIGKNLVSYMFEGCGFEVINLGVDVSAEKFVTAVREYKPQIVCLSALLTTTMTYMKQVIDSLSDAGLRESVLVFVGGAPLNEAFAKSIGADIYTSNANSAVVKAKELLNL